MKRTFYLEKEKCMGCTNCMRKCPTEAIRILDGKAVIDDDKCINCGECIRVCPYNAYTSITDKILNLKGYKFNIAIPSTTVYGQFTLGTEICKIHNALIGLGFDFVYDESWAAELVTKAIKEKVMSDKTIRPKISSNCPSMVRLIKIKYPGLLDNIIEIEAPMEIAARLAIKKAKKIDKELKDEEIGVFYISPCPAKTLSVKKPIGKDKSYINKVISLKEIYGDMVRELKMHSDKCFSNPSLTGLKWSISGGQTDACDFENSIAVSGLENVIDVLEEIEMGKLNHIEYLEVLSCNGGCVGGTYNFENPFVANSNIKHILKNIKEEKLINDDIEKYQEFKKEGYFDISIHEEIEEKKPNIKEAVKKMDRIEKIYKKLPKLDCGSCGAPTCRALAEDIEEGKKTIDNCVILKLEEK
ncbi:MAG: [Fe-Fe] hydrogenase large subunit C-terminal domain-containing protein [Bacillota bacterium]|nr:[Fe-Fe] hydrogenase large subunit C-terminal domain-containing protein [Bacillota bacterium]